MTFVFDTNSLRVLMNYYPKRFPTFWDHFDEAVKDGTVRSVREVYNELAKQVSHKWLWDWIKENRHCFGAPSGAETAIVAEIFTYPKFRELVGNQQRLRGYPVADPFVVAAAKASGGCVVTEERHKPNAAKIPNVCKALEVECVNFEGFLDQLDWVF